jgi:hypothetical protein
MGAACGQEKRSGIDSRNSLSCRAIEAQQRAVPDLHSDILTSYRNVGDFYWMWMGPHADNAVYQDLSGSGTRGRHFQ